MILLFKSFCTIADIVDAVKFCTTPQFRVTVVDAKTHRVMHSLILDKSTESAVMQSVIPSAYMSTLFRLSVETVHTV